MNDPNKARELEALAAALNAVVDANEKNIEYKNCGRYQSTISKLVDRIADRFTESTRSLTAAKMLRDGEPPLRVAAYLEGGRDGPV